MSDVSVLGTGLMGTAFVRTLLAAGFSVTAWNRTPERASALASQGATLAPSPADALRSSPVSILSMMGYDSVRDVLEQALPEGPTGDVVNLTSGTPDDADELAGYAAGRGVRLIEGAIFGYPPQVGSDDLRIVYSGDRATYERHEQLLLQVAGGSRYLGAAPRLANTLDVAMLVVAGSMVPAMMEGFAFGVALGLDPADVAEVYEGVVTRGDASLRGYLAHLRSGDHTTDTAAISTWKLGMQTVVTACERAGVPSRLAAAAVAAHADAEADGWGGAGVTGLYQHRLDRRARAHRDDDPERVA